MAKVRRKNVSHLKVVLKEKWNELFINSEGFSIDKFIFHPEAETLSELQVVPSNAIEIILLPPLESHH